MRVSDMSTGLLGRTLLTLVTSKVCGALGVGVRCELGGIGF